MNGSLVETIFFLKNIDIQNSKLRYGKLFELIYCITEKLETKHISNFFVFAVQLCKIQERPEKRSKRKVRTDKAKMLRKTRLYLQFVSC